MGDPLAHESTVHSFVSSKTSLSAFTTIVVVPMSAHCVSLQSPTACDAIAVPSASVWRPHIPVSQDGSTHSLSMSGSGQSVGPIQPPAPPPPALVVVPPAPPAAPVP